MTTRNEKILGVSMEENISTLEWPFSIFLKENDISLGFSSQTKPYLSDDDQQSFYNAYIRPHLQYSSVITGNLTKLNIKK